MDKLEGHAHSERPRARDLGLIIGFLPTGEHNGITDVAGVRVGHSTLMFGEGPLLPGHGPVRTGVTVVLPHGGNLYWEKVRAAVHTINGFGKPFGFEQIRELGLIESPIALTNTLNVGLVADALVQYAIRESPELRSVNVVVGETNDAFLNDIQGRHVRAEHVGAAIEAASAGPVQEGATGAGTGTTCFGWKGGIGTASRVAPAEAGAFTVGALVQSNFGNPQQLIMGGVPVGRYLLPPGTAPRDQGSIMMVLATDAPLSARQLERLCVRAGAGLARTGSSLGHGSGDFVIGFSTAETVPQDSPSLLQQSSLIPENSMALEWLFVGAAESVEEAVLNSLCRAETVVGRDGHTRHALPLDKVAALLDERAR